ncbi:MAG: 30S ribosomal protein S7e [Piptocephalis tieghemiana]|nr:MAG: 30S ribosomal protein S7e [Piptocephalis tieghemiana]
MASIKIVKPAGAAPADELELQVAQAIFDLEKSSAELKKDLRPIQITAAKELDIAGGRKAIVIFVPVPVLKQTQRVHARLTRELEKKFSDRHVLFVSQRRIMPKPTRRSRQKQMRPRSRTLTAVHNATLEDIVYPTEIVGKRTRVKTDGSKIIKVFLDSKDAATLEYKVDTFASVYKKLTGKDVHFEFPAHQIEQ